MCSYIAPDRLLVSFARTGTAARELLTHDHFSHSPLKLDARRLSVLSSLAPSSIASPFRSRVLLGGRLAIRLDTRAASAKQLLDALEHFPRFDAWSVGVEGRFTAKEMSGEELAALLHHPALRLCKELELSGFQRTVAETDPRLPQAASSTLERPFSWHDVRLPCASVFRLAHHTDPLYTGAAAFLSAHTALREVDVDEQFVSVAELTTIFRNPAALPCLSRFTLRGHHLDKRTRWLTDFRPLVSALASTVVTASGTTRPIEMLQIDGIIGNDALSAAAPMSALSRLVIKGSMPHWMEEWTQKLHSSFPLLQQLSVHGMTFHPNADAAAASRQSPLSFDVSVWLQCVAARSLQTLDIQFGNIVSFAAAALTQLTRCDQLRVLRLTFSDHSTHSCMDWTDKALFASLRLPSLHELALHSVRFSAVSLASVLSSTPALRAIELSHAELTCHPAVACALVGGYCRHIEEVSFVEKKLQNLGSHGWSDVQAEEVVSAFQSAVAARASCQPFTSLRSARFQMCWCTPASVWHALLSLMKHAAHVRCVAEFASVDPLVVSSLSHLPSVSALSEHTRWPLSFAALMERRSKRSGRYRFVAADEVKGVALVGCPTDRSWLSLTDGEAEPTSIRLRPRARLLAAYQRSLSAEQQALLSRWSAAQFQPGDGQLSAAESELHAGNCCLCAHPLVLHCRKQVAAIDVAMNEAHEEESSESDEDEMQS